MLKTIKASIQFHFLTTISLKHRRILKDYILFLFKKEGKKLRSLNYIFCDDAYLLEINKKHLNHDDYTDIISFDLSGDDLSEGEIYISIDRIRENASVYKVPLKEELLRVMFHGALHLCGYKDKNDFENRLMRKMEDFYLKGYEKFVSRKTVSK